MKQPIAVGYIRVSTEDQTKNYSLQFQQEHIEKFCQEKDLQLKTIYDENFGSGSNVTQRPVFQEMMDTVLNSDDIKYIVVLADHRFSRDHADAVNEVKKLHAKNKYLRIISDDLNTEDSDHYTFFQLKSIISERQRKSILFNTKEGMRQRAKNGFYNGGRVTGYKSLKTGLEIADGEAAIVKEIFDKFVHHNFGFRKVAQYLNEDGSKTINNEEWTVFAVKNILTNSLYIGKIKFEKKEYQGKHQPLISLETWHKAQQLLAVRSTTATIKRAGRNFLAGTIKCPECKGPMVHFSQSKYAYYQCSRNKNGKKCGANLIPKEMVEDAAIDYLISYIESPLLLPVLEQKFREATYQRERTLKKLIFDQQRTVKAVEQKIEKTYDLFYNDSNDFHRKQIEKLGNDLHTSVNKLDAHQEEYEQLTHLNFNLDTQRHFRDIFKTLEAVDQKNLVQSVIKEIHIEQADKPKKRKIKSIVPQFTMDEFLQLVDL